MARPYCSGMTEKTAPIYDDPLRDLIESLKDCIAELGAMRDEKSFARAEALSRQISTHVKALRDLAQLEQDTRARADAQKYTPYDKRPPLSPEEHEQLLERVLAVFDRIFDEESQAEMS